MSRRTRIPDVKRAGRSSLVPYRRGEAPMERHTRRLHSNLHYEVQVREWCRKHDFNLRITNQGHHWQLTKDKFIAEWWPSSAKLVFNKQWNRGCHCHDYRQALEMIERVYVKPQQAKAEAGLDFTRSNRQESS